MIGIAFACLIADTDDSWVGPQPEFTSLKEATQMKREMCPSVEARSQGPVVSRSESDGGHGDQFADLTKHMGLRLILAW